MKDFLTLQDISLSNKRVLIREDFNVPITDGFVQNDMRIKAALSGIKEILDKNAQIILMSHLGRPSVGDKTHTLLPVAKRLEELLDVQVDFMPTWPPTLSDNKVILLENVRLLEGELENSDALAKEMASLCDVFVFDAFACAHRAHASTVGVIKYAHTSVAGPLLVQELQMLDKIMHSANHPLIVVIGGAKVSSKIDVLRSLYQIADVLIMGGGMANTLLAAQQYNVGMSLYEPNCLNLAKELIAEIAQSGCELVLPQDVITNTGLNKMLVDLDSTDKICDIGPKTIDLFNSKFTQAETILWNGPMGIFEDKKFANGTNALAKTIAKSQGFTVAGGGETIAAIEELGLDNDFSYISTGGGAFLEYIEGKKLPSVVALTEKMRGI